MFFIRPDDEEVMQRRIWMGKVMTTPASTDAMVKIRWMISSNDAVDTEADGNSAGGRWLPAFSGSKPMTDEVYRESLAMVVETTKRYRNN